MKLLVLFVGKGASPWARSGVEHYSRRIRAYIPLEELRIKPALFRGDTRRVQEDEGRRVLKQLRPGDRLILLDERGSSMDSAGFASLLRRYSNSSCKRLLFCIGGPYGHGTAARRGADMVISLSSMVMNHELARLVLYEQIYRALTICSGHPYHH